MKKIIGLLLSVLLFLTFGMSSSFAALNKKGTTKPKSSIKRVIRNSKKNNKKMVKKAKKYRKRNKAAKKAYKKKKAAGSKTGKKKK